MPLVVVVEVGARTGHLLVLLSGLVVVHRGSCRLVVVGGGLRRVVVAGTVAGVVVVVVASWVVGDPA